MPVCALPLDEALELVAIGDADVPVAVGRQDDAVDGRLVEARFRHPIGVLDARRARRRAACAEAVDGRHDALLLGHLGRPEPHVGACRIGHDRHGVVGLEVVEQHAERVLQQRQAVLRRHRSRDVDQEHEIGARPLRAVELVALDGDVHQPVGLVPGRREHADRRQERHVGALGARIGVGEVVDHLLDAHCVLRRQPSAVERTPHERVGRGIDVERERRNRLLRHLLDRIGRHRLEPVSPLLDLRLSPRLKRARRNVNPLWRPATLSLVSQPQPELID